MNTFSKYSWPSKLKKFGITDPFLKILVTKYEREIPWQNIVRDSETLLAYVQDEMLPKLFARVEYPPDRSTKNFFINRYHVNLEVALRSANDFDHVDMSRINAILLKQGKISATEALVDDINMIKAQAFRVWITRLQETYPAEPVFWLLVLRPIFELAGRGNRRSIFEPSDDIIEWLHRRILRGRFSPYDNLARHYCLKLGSGSTKSVRDGWRHIPADLNNAAKLSALCRGSGWCVAEQSFAASYLSYSAFYILYSKARPVVALRQKRNSNLIVECQGRSNSNPAQWFNDIQLFIETRNLELEDRTAEMDRALQAGGNVDFKPLHWWKDRIRLWPFAIFFAPEPFHSILMAYVTASVVLYADFDDFETLKDLIGLPPDMGMDEGYWREILEFNPELYPRCPDNYRNEPSVCQACLNGWLERLEQEEIVFSEMESIPDFVKDSPDFLTNLREHFPSAVHKIVRKHRTTRKERENPFCLDEILPIIPDEPADLVIERMVNILLNIEDGIFSDQKFPDALRRRDDFDLLRIRAWQSGIQAMPPLWFALPKDLKKRDEFEPLKEVSRRVDLLSWLIKVEKMPWLLTQNNGFPKMIRCHHQVLEAYRKGWQPYLIESPWRIWVKRGLHRRVYMSHALLADEKVVETLAQGWRNICWDDLYDTWIKASARMRDIPAIQLSVLRAISESTNSIYLGGCSDVIDEIYRRHNRSMKANQGNNPLSEEIEALLKTMWYS